MRIVKRWPSNRQPPAIITLTTDFGEGSRYVAAMKGVILSINPEAQIVDLSHSMPPQDIRSGAIVAGRDGPLVSAGDDPRRGGRSGRRQQAADRLRPNRHAAFHRARQRAVESLGRSRSSRLRSSASRSREFWLPRRVGARFTGATSWRRWRPG